MPSSYLGVQEPAPASQTAKLDIWNIDRGGTTIGREIMVLGGSASDGLLFGASAAPSAGGLGLPVWPINSSGALASGNPLHVFLQGSTATVTVQGNVSAAISGNATAVISNTSGNITTGNPLAVFLQGSTATVTIQGNVSAAIAGNTTAVIGNASGVFTTGNPLPVYLQGSTATVTVQGNVSAVITTAQKIQVEPIAGAVFGISGNTTAIISTAFPAYIPTNGTTASGGLLVMGLDGTATNSTARPLQVNTSGELKTVAAVSIGGLVQINTSGGSTMMLVGGVDGGTSNSTARPLRVNSSGELLTVGGTVTVPGNGVINTTAGSSGLLMLGADGNTTNSTARFLQVNASQELIVKGTIVGNTSVVGNVSAIITTAQAIQVEGKSGAVFPISGNASAILSTAGMGGTTASPVYIAAAPQLGQLYQGTTALAPQFASINVTASGITQIVASAAGAIYVLALQFTAKSSCTVQWFEATTSGITGVQSIAADGGMVLPLAQTGWFKTASGVQLALSVQGTSGGVGGSLVYARPAS